MTPIEQITDDGNIRAALSELVSFDPAPSIDQMRSIGIILRAKNAEDVLLHYEIVKSMSVPTKVGFLLIKRHQQALNAINELKQSYVPTAEERAIIMSFRPQ